MISQAVSPLPVSIYMAFDPAARHRDGDKSPSLHHEKKPDQEGMKPHFYMDMLIQIY